MAAERPREVRALAVAHKARHIGDGSRRLREEDVRPDREAPREQVLAKGAVPELLEAPLQLTGGARER
jgi:hypothetical protein